MGDSCHFATAEQTARHLAAAGFTDIDARCVPDPARLGSSAQLEAFLTTVVLSAVLDQLPAGQHQQFVRDVQARLPEPAVDFVRLQVCARAQSGPSAS